MKFIYTCIAALILLAGCQKDDNYLVKEAAFSVVISGFNGSSNELEVRIDTLTLPGPIQAGASFKRTDKYTFPPEKDSIKLIIKEKGTDVQVYAKEVKRGEYSHTIELIYVNGKLIEKPTAPANNPDGFKLASFLFLPRVTDYTGDIDIVFFKKYEFVENNKLVLEKMEELAKITAKPYEFSEFLKAPVFQAGRTEMNGKIYFLNQQMAFFKAGTNIPYYQDAGATIRPNVTFPYLTSAKPQIMAVVELGVPGSTYIENYQQIQF